MKELVIAPKQEGKGRSFCATLVAYVTADNLWAGGATSTEVTRPVWAMFAGTDNELRPFMANLQLGRKAEAFRGGYSRKAGDKFEILKSSGFQTAWQRTPLGSVAVVYAPDLFRLDPGMVDPKGVEFCIMPAEATLAGMKIDPKAAEHLASLELAIPKERHAWLLQMAPLFIAYLDRRTRCPLIPDPRFYVQVLAYALHWGLATWSLDADSYYSSYNLPFGCHKRHGFKEYRVKDVGHADGLAFEASHDELEKFLADQVKVYFDAVKEG